MGGWIVARLVVVWCLFCCVLFCLFCFMGVLDRSVVCGLISFTNVSRSCESAFVVFVIIIAIVVTLLPKSVNVTPSQQMFWYHDFFFETALDH